MEKNQFKKAVTEFYTAVAENKLAAKDGVSRSLYSAADLADLPEGADLNLGCGNPLELARPREDDRVLDLGCGRGLDLYIALKTLGPEGRAIGVDNNEAMLKGARRLAEKAADPRLSFLKGELDDLPLADESVTLVTSNCAINLCPDKKRVYAEIARVLRPGGRGTVSDITLTAPLPEEIRENPRYAGT